MFSIEIAVRQYIEDEALFEITNFEMRLDFVGVCFLIHRRATQIDCWVLTSVVVGSLHLGIDEMLYINLEIRGCS